MNKVGNYGIYQKNYYENKTQSKKDTETAKSAKAGQAQKAAQPALSERAEALLKELKKTYKNMDFMVADYEDDEEAAAYLARGTKEYSVLIDPETLEEMAADKKTKEKYLGLLDEATGKLSDLKEQLSDEEGKEVTHLGVSIGKDGSISYFAELEQLSAKQKERIEKSKEAKKEEEKKAAKKEASDAGKVPAEPKRTRVTAKSVKELLEKIRNVDWDQVSEPKTVSGNRFDCSI